MRILGLEEITAAVQDRGKEMHSLEIKLVPHSVRRDVPNKLYDTGLL